MYLDKPSSLRFVIKKYHFTFGNSHGTLKDRNIFEISKMLNKVSAVTWERWLVLDDSRFAD